jgi:hypothetical protein
MLEPIRIVSPAFRDSTNMSDAFPGQGPLKYRTAVAETAAETECSANVVPAKVYHAEANASVLRRLARYAASHWQILICRDASKLMMRSKFRWNLMGCIRWRSALFCRERGRTSLMGPPIDDRLRIRESVLAIAKLDAARPSPLKDNHCRLARSWSL